MKTALLINDTSKEEYHIGCISVIKTIYRLCDKNNIKIVKSYSRNELINGYDADIIKTLNSPDIIIVNGEGSLHHHPRSNTTWFIRLLDMLPTNKKVILINSLWQDMSKIANLKKELDKFAFISVREILSYKNLLTIYNKPEKIIITPDIIFATKINNSTEGYGDSVCHELRDQLDKYKNYFPLCFVSKGTYLHPKKLTIPTLQGYFIWLKSLKFYVTGRFHGVCLSAMANVPFLALPSNSHKIESILKDMGCPELLIPSIDKINNVNKELATKLVPKAHKYAIEAKNKIEKLFQRIAKS